ncbi:MAG: hypothetical protein ACRBDI_08865 [Alphaproteobacteria bacterium]
MPFLKPLFLGVFFAVFFMAGVVQNAIADELLVSDVASFLNIQEQMYPIDEEFRSVGEYSIFRPKAMDLAKTGQPAYQANVEYVKENHLGFYDRFSSVAISYMNDKSEKPYDSLEQWGEMGDRIMTAFYAANTDKAGDMKLRLQQMPPEVAALINSIPEAKKTMDEAIGAMDTMANVSDHDQQVVRQFSKQIVLHINKVKGMDGYAVSE